jgi:uncharacterized protein YwgA
MNAEEIAVNLIKLSPGQLVGRTRLQKEAYLLDRCGAELGLPFTYHYYGPYSFELADGWEDALAEGRIEIEEELRRYGVSYSLFKLKKPCSGPDNLGNLPAADARARLEKMAAVSEIVLELAATIIYLKEEGYGEPPIKELKTRKPLKATDKLIKKATALLSDLELPVASD